MLETGLSNGMSIDGYQYEGDDITVQSSGGKFIETQKQGIGNLSSAETLQFIMPGNNAKIRQNYE